MCIVHTARARLPRLCGHAWPHFSTMVDAAPVFYRTVDPIENLELRVTLRCVDSGRTAQRGRNGSMASSRRMRGSSAGTGELEEKALQVGDGAGSVAGSVEERSWTQVLKWQDKVFGPRYVR